MKTVAGLLPGIDVRGVGGFVNIAGGKYQILRLTVSVNLIPWGKLPKRILAALNGSKPAPKTKQGTPIPETTRNATLTSRAGAMRRKGADQAAIEAALLEINASQCQPPLSELEVLKIVESVSRYEPNPDTKQPAHFNLTDYGNAERLVGLYGDAIRYSPERKTWLIWTGKVWEWDTGGVKIAKLAKKTARNIYREAADEPNDDLREALVKDLVKHAMATERQIRLDAMIKSAESEPGIAAVFGGSPPTKPLPRRYAGVGWQEDNVWHIAKLTHGKLHHVTSKSRPQVIRILRGALGACGYLAREYHRKVLLPDLRASTVAELVKANNSPKKQGKGH